MVSAEQIQALVEYLEMNSQMALGNFSRSTEGRSLARRKWQELAEILNSLTASPESVRKKAELWRVYFNEYKSKIVKKIKKHKLQVAEGSAKGPLRLEPLQARMYAIMRRNVGERRRPRPQDPLEHETKLKQDDCLAFDNGSNHKVDRIAGGNVKTEERRYPWTPERDEVREAETESVRQPRRVNELRRAPPKLSMDELERVNVDAILELARTNTQLALAQRDLAASTREMAAAIKQVAVAITAVARAPALNSALSQRPSVAQDATPVAAKSPQGKLEPRFDVTVECDLD